MKCHFDRIVTILKNQDDGQTFRIDYSEGWFRGYFKNGNLRYEWKYIDDTPLPSRDVYENKTLKRQDGISRCWWSNGQIKSEKNWKDGGEQGSFTEWYENGQKKRHIENQLDGKQDGLETKWDKNGEKLDEIRWSKGKKISTNRFDKQYFLKKKDLR
jgi:antitoxin component YwqK of YwqJK toxin-antitoxin module